MLQHYCHESGLWTSVHSPPEVTRSPHGLLHHTNCCTSPRTTVPIIYCTDDTHTADCTDYTADSHHTPYLSHGLPQSDRWVLETHVATLADSYLTEHSGIAIAMPVFILACVSWFNPLPCYFGLCLPLPGLLLAYLDYLSLPCPVGYCFWRSKTHACPKNTLYLASSMSVCCVSTNACFMTTPFNKALQMDLHNSCFCHSITITCNKLLSSTALNSWIYFIIFKSIPQISLQNQHRKCDSTKTIWVLL